MIIRDKKFSGYTYVMAIINLTPDSFYSNSRKTADNVLFAVEKAIKDGASIIDLGVQSTRPGYVEVDAQTEIARLEKPLFEIRKNFDVPISVDTYFSATANRALEMGADMINDVWGLTHDEDMARVVAKYNASVCIMHNKKSAVSDDLWGEVIPFLQNSVNLALASGISADKICLDGGIGFAKNREQNFELLNGYEKLSALGYPLLLGTSRKSMFGGKVEDRLAPTLQSTATAVKKGVLFVRVHDVLENVKVIKDLYGRN